MSCIFPNINTGNQQPKGQEEGEMCSTISTTTWQQSIPISTKWSFFRDVVKSIDGDNEGKLLLAYLQRD